MVQVLFHPVLPFTDIYCIHLARFLQIKSFKQLNEVNYRIVTYEAPSYSTAKGVLHGLLWSHVNGDIFSHAYLKSFYH